MSDVKRNKKIEAGYKGREHIVDAHRKIPRTEGGEYTEENTEVLSAVEHMKEHGNYRERPIHIDDLKSLVDDRQQVMKLRNKLSNQIMAVERNTDKHSDDTLEWLNSQLSSINAKLNEKTKMVEKAVLKFSEEDALTKAALGVKGIGPITVAYCAVYLDLDGYYPDDYPVAGKRGKEKCPHASSLWSYVGFDKPAKDRFEKGVSSGGNKNLRTVLYTMAEAQMKGRGAYREIYDNTKFKLERSERKVWTRLKGGKWVEKMWKDVAPCHRNGAALRDVAKHFLADYWYVGRTILGLPVSHVYPVAHLREEGHQMIMPEERGWVYDSGNKSDDITIVGDK